MRPSYNSGQCSSLAIQMVPLPLLPLLPLSQINTNVSTNVRLKHQPLLCQNEG